MELPYAGEGLQWVGPQVMKILTDSRGMALGRHEEV